MPTNKIMRLETRKKVKPVEAEAEITEMTELANKIFKIATRNILHMFKNLKKNMNTIIKNRRHEKTKPKKEPHRIFGGKNTICEMRNSLDGVKSRLEDSVSEL